jgi:hypothetical protein
MVNSRKTKLKGGSLSSTYLIEQDNKKFIRKTVSLTENREYGYVRWYSQLKKLQRYNTEFPRLFPKVLNVSYEKEDAYFDLQYMDGYSDLYTILSGRDLSEHELKKINHALWNAFKELHRIDYVPNSGAALLYFKEEIEQKLIDANKFDEFNKFCFHGTYELNGEIVHGITNFMDELRNFFTEMNLINEECIHGNPTLENTLYSFVDDMIVFVDPYEESIIDSRFLDYSMVLQSSHSLYEHFNNQPINVENSKVWCNDIQQSDNFRQFNKLFTSELVESRTKKIVDVLEATQFIRMLPFKCAAGNYDHAKYFYLHACKLFSKIFI